MNSKTKTAVAVLSLIASTAAFSQANPATPDYTLSYNVGVVNDYRFRGIEQTRGQPSVQGGVDFAHKSGIYLGVWAASGIKWIQEFNGATKGDYEVDLYGGYKGEAFKGLGFDVGAITYQYPGNDSGSAGVGKGFYSKADTTEIYGALTYSVLTFKYSQSVGDFLGNLNSNGSRYFDLSATFDLGNGFTIVPHIGVQTIPNQSLGTKVGDAANYTDYALTLAKDFGNGFVGSVAAVGTDAKESGANAFYRQTSPNRFLGSSAVVLGLKYNF
jgi:uncharacterized protein (TIGR02001 family)